MLNIPVIMLLLSGLGLLQWASMQYGGRCPTRNLCLRAAWQAHALFSLAMLAGGMRWLERLWLHTLWPEPWLGLAVLASLWLLYGLIVQLRFHRLPCPGPARPVLALGAAWLAGWALVYLLPWPHVPAVLTAGLLAGALCGLPSPAAMLTRGLAGLLAAGAVAWLLELPEAAVQLAGTLPGHYNSLALAGMLLPWLLLPLWLLPSLLGGRPPPGFCKPVHICYRRHSTAGSKT